LPDIAHAGTFHRLRGLEEGGDLSLHEYPNVTAWMGRVEGRESYKASA
jgi:glutathione S-transferase